MPVGFHCNNINNDSGSASGKLKPLLKAELNHSAPLSEELSPVNPPISAIT
jgi:hypothetical protein